MMYYQYIVPNPFYELKYDVTIYNQFFYNVLVATIYPFTIYSSTNFPSPTVLSVKMTKMPILAFLEAKKD
jgi:hypothetical protein